MGLAFTAFTFGRVNAASGAIRWETSISRATTIARETNQPLLVEFWATWCETCAAMDATVYSDGRVASAMRKVIPVRVDIDREPGISRKYEISGTPTLMLTDAYGNELFRFVGSLPVERVVQLLEELPPDTSRINQLAGMLAKDKDRFDALSALGRELRREGFYVASTRYLTRALRAREAGRGTDVRAGLLLDIGRNQLDLKTYDEALQTFGQAIREKPGSPSEADAMLGSAKALRAQGKAAEARRVLEALAERHRGSAAGEEAARLLADTSGH